MRLSIAAVAFGLLALGAYSGAQPCSCLTIGADDYRGLLQSTDAVFRGTVLQVHDLAGVPGRDLQNSALRLVVFQVNGAWKGINQRVAYVFTGRGGGDCGYPFQEGTEYVVWATRDGGNAPGELTTDICRSTRDVHDAAGQLKQLGKPKQVLK